MMSHKDRAIYVVSMLRKYSANKREVDEFSDETAGLRAHEPPLCRPSQRADPTAKTAMKRLNAPGGMQFKKDWIAAITDARAECKVIDEQEDCGFGLEYVLAHAYALESDAPMDRREIMKNCGFAVATYYNRMNLITEIVMFHAAKHGLL